MTRMGTALTATILTIAIGSLAGCGDSATGTGDDAGTSNLPPATFDYVISNNTVDQGVNAAGMPNGMAPVPASHTQGVAGFDLDGLKSTPADAMMRGTPACSHADFFSTTDPDQNTGTCTAGMARGGASCQGGVDNQLPEIAATVQGFGTDIRMTLSEQVQQGKVAILVRVSDVNGTPGPTLNDSNVTIRVYPISRPMFASCSNIGMPGQTFAVDNTSLNTPNDLNSAKIQFTGSIVNGRLRVAPPSAAATMANFTFNLPIMNMNIPLSLFRTQLRVDMTTDRGTNGNLGGYAQLRPLAAMLGMLLPAGIPESTVQTVLQSLVDVQDPSGNAMGCTAPNGGISLGLGFSTVRAVIAPMSVMGAQAGMCGSM
jgi:hypothetical protein